MKLSDLWRNYQDYTAELTRFARQLAFAAAAICWFFRSPDLIFPSRIRTSLVLVVAYFACDILQYYLASIVLFAWARIKERAVWREHHTVDADVPKPAWLDWPALSLFHAKVICLLSSFWYIAMEFLSRQG